MPTQISRSSVADLAAGLSDLPLTDTRAAALEAELVRLNAAVRQAATMLHFDSAPGDFQRVLEAAARDT